MKAHAFVGGEDRQHHIIGRDDGSKRFGLVLGDVDEDTNIRREFTQLVKIQHCGYSKRNKTEWSLAALGY